MKKVISVLLAMLMIFALFSCSGKTPGSSPSASPSAAASPSPSVAASPSQEAAPSPSAPTDVSATADEVGFFTDGVDPQSRKTYNIVHMYPFTLLLFEKMTECFKVYEKRLNVNITSSTSEGDMEKFISNIQTLSDQGKTDGFMVVIDAATAPRIKEVLDETKIPYMTWCNSVRDASGSELTPCVGLDQKAASATTVQWLYDNYKTYWGDIDPTQIALMNTNASINVDLNDRAIGAAEKFKELLPKNAGIFDVDVLDFTQDSAYNQASTIFAGNPDIKYWFVANCVEMYAQGVTRAAEAIKIDDRVLVTDVGSDILCSEWDTNFDGCWKSCLAISNYLYAAPALCGLVAMIDGKATPDSLWASLRAPGDKYTFYGAASSMITKDTYKDYFNGYAEKAGAPLPYAK